MVFRAASSLLLTGLVMTQAPTQPAPSGIAAFVRVYALATPGLSAPIPLNQPKVVAQAMTELGGVVELEITVGVDGYVRDGLIKSSRGGVRVEAASLRAAANSRFQPGTMNGSHVPVRMPLILTVSER